MTLLLFLACQAPDEEALDSAPPPDPMGGTAPLAEVSAGSCPAGLSEGGDLTLRSNGKEREVTLLIPDSGAQGAPVVFVWHPLGGTGKDMIRWLQLRAWSNEVGAVVVVPDALDTNTYEWGFLGDATDDLTLYDDLRTCLVEELAVDPKRFSATGMSAGGLWTSYLGIHRGDTLATILPFSGGTPEFIAYEPPKGAFPVLFFHGGESDIWGGGLVNFYEATLAYAEALSSDGHFVAICDHGGGHTMPPESRDAMTAWLPGQVFGEPSAFEGQGLEALARYCAAWEQ